MLELGRVVQGNCLEVMRSMATNSIDAVVTDPPYGLSFMGKKWDYDVPSVEIWAECLRVLKPGGHLLAFAGTRTQHRMAVRIEDAGFEIRDLIAWVYGSGFPKSLDVSKAIDDRLGAVREVISERAAYPVGGAGVLSGHAEGATAKVTAPASPEATYWQGWGTALKPALEPITVARKPPAGTVAANVLAHGTGGINIDGCRVPAEIRTGWAGAGSSLYEGGLSRDGGEARPVDGRWPANFIHDGSDEVVEAFPEAKGAQGVPSAAAFGESTRDTFGNFATRSRPVPRGDTGSAARFFYCAKASKSDRDEGLSDFTPDTTSDGPAVAADNAYQRGKTERRNTHPTVKPTALMRYLCRLVTPPGGLVLDPFTGSGSTGRAAMLEGFRFIGAELDPKFVEVAQARIAYAWAAALDGPVING